MSCAVRLNLSVCQGKTYEQELIWGVYPTIYKTIQNIERSAPARLTVPSHGLIEDWPFAISHVEGMTEVNDVADPPSTFYPAVVVDADTVEINSLVTLGFSEYTGSGIIRYATYPNFSGMEGLFVVRDRVGGNELLRLDTSGGGVQLDNVRKKIILRMTAEQTAAIDFTKGVYELELRDGLGTVYGVATGSFKVTREVAI